MRPLQIDSQATSWNRPNLSGPPAPMDHNTTPSQLIDPSHSQQIMLQQQQQRCSVPIFHSPLSFMQTGPIRTGLQNPNIISPNPASLGFRRLLAEMRTRQFDSIRFAAYRTASKLRFIQQRTLFNIMDLWRVVETFREFGLHQLNDPQATLDYASTFRLLSRIYSHIPTTNLNANSTADETSSNNAFNRSVLIVAAEILLGWLGYALDLCATGRLSVTGLKIALSTLTNARPADKFRYHFTLLSDPSGALIFSKFEAYLQDLLKLPISVFEGTNFYYTPQAAQTMFTGRSKSVVVEEFLDRMLSDQGPQVLVWLTIFHRLISVANVRHNVRCEGCKREQICGLRYKCTRCPHYNLCQDCFWIGVTTDQHTNAHDVKEYSAASKSHSRQFGHSLRKSFQFGRTITNSSSSSNTTTALSFTSSFSERQQFSGVNAARRPHVGSIFEWNSDPAAPTGIISGINGITSAVQPTAIPIDITTSISNVCHPGQPVSNQRFMAPVNTICSPLPNRRLQQLNPLLMATRPNTNMSSLTYLPPQPIQVQPVFKRMNELSQAPKGVSQNLVAATGYTNTMQHDTTTANYTRPGHGVQYSEISTGSNISSLPGANHQPLPMSCYSNPTTDAYLMGSNQHCQQQQQQQLATTMTSQSTAQFTSATSVDNNDNLIGSSMGTSFSLKTHNVDQKSNEEHNLIARYAAQLAAASALNQEFDKLGNFVESTQTQKQLIAQLQEKNRKILKEIERLRVEQQKQAAYIAAAGSLKNDSSDLQEVCDDSTSTFSPANLKQLPKSDNLVSSGVGSLMNPENPRLVADLQALRQRKDELESRMNNLQRSRTDLMLQLEALVRLLSVSTGVTYTRDNNSSALFDSNDIRRTGHNSRLDQKNPDYPPRRSTSLCHPSGGRSYQDNFYSDSKYDGANGIHQKPSSSDNVGKIFSPLKTITVEERGGQWNFKFPDDKKHELHSPSSISYRHSPELGHQRSSDTLVEKYKDLLYKGTNTQIGAFKSLRVHFGSRRPYVGTLSADDKTELFSHNSVNINRLSSNHSSQHTNHSDSGSDAYLYSDPELCFTVVTSTCVSSQSSVSVPQRTLQLPQFLSITPSSLKSSNKSKEFLELLNEKIITTTTIVDNYEYAGLQSSPISPLSYSSNEHTRNTRIGVGSNNTTTTNP
ncbi:Dystrobrevin-1 isoform 1 [Schistosoma japonicum]|uniref:Dystrobrevin-1 isoform 1 n=2 Tax=Schistosoma japonicum TaxID=6182 RepID=A0A4Z2DRM8_SCHJA|nr:Dystrobrevin-1 [Schistosoma japonicum]KAH8864591.1 Dystrobrevin-1 [Schistosoma japonicum]KAH8864593.1 Dystrobrevin-1 [Schistosoma japonicum]TNN19082.1 Dystrobrevin-1 isoform 1 [Schistosoma japonicum]